MTRRIGRNTALSFSLFPLGVLAVLAVGSLANNDGILAVGPWLLLAAFVWWLARAHWAFHVHQTTHDELEPSCKHCADRAGELRELEAHEAVAADMARLSRKYQS